MNSGVESPSRGWTRRDFVARVGMPVVLYCAGCTSASTVTEPIEQPFAEVLPDEIIIHLAGVPSFAAPDSVLVIYEANVIVLHLDGTDYRAFTNICTHAGCGIHMFVDKRFKCQCHGSEYDVNGLNVVGPALFPLKRYATSIDSSGGILRIDRRS